MTLQEFKELVGTLRSMGVTHYKTPELELNLEPTPPPQPLAVDQPEKIPHVIEELTSLFKMSDNDFAKRIFPDPPLEKDGDE